MEKSSHEIEPWNNKDIVLSVFKGVESPFSRASVSKQYLLQRKISFTGSPLKFYYLDLFSKM